MPVTDQHDRPRRHTIVSSLLVAAQFVLAAALVLATRVMSQHWGGLLASLLGVIVGAWAMRAMGVGRIAVTPDVQADATLVTSGPYRWLRHPMYTALLLLCGGLVFVPFAWWKLVSWFLLCGVLILKSRMEEQQLRRRFATYHAYAARTARFVPFLW